MADPKTASFTQPGIVQPYAQEFQQNGLEQQQLLEALQQQQAGQTGAAIRPIQAGRLSALNLEGAGNAIAEALTQKKLEINRKKQADTMGAYSNAAVEAERKYIAERDGSSVDTAGPPEVGQGQPQQTFAGNPMAYKGAVTSLFPRVGAMGEEDRKSYEDLRKTLIGKSSPQSALSSAGDIRGLRAETKTEFHNDAAWQMPQEAGQVPQLLSGVTQSTLPSGTIINNLPGGKQDAVDKATKVTLNTGDHAMKGIVDALPKDLESAHSANKILRSTETALSALKAGAKTGAGEEWKQSARTFIESLTGLKFEATTPTAVLAKALAENVVNEFGGKLGSGVSNADVEFMKLASGGLATDAGALERILAIRAAAAYSRVKEHNANIADLAEQKGVDNGEYLKRRYTLAPTKFSYEFTTPEARASFESGVANTSYEEVLKREMAVAPSKGSPKYSPEDLDLFRKNGYTPRGH